MFVQFLFYWITLLQLYYSYILSLYFHRRFYILLLTSVPVCNYRKFPVFPFSLYCSSLFTLVQIDLLQGDEIESILFCSHWLDLSLILRPSFSTLLTSLSCLVYSSTMKTEAVDSSETLVNLYRNTTRQISKRGNTHNHRCGNLICYRVCNRQVHSYKMEVLILNFHLCESGVSNEDFSI